MVCFAEFRERKQNAGKTSIFRDERKRNTKHVLCFDETSALNSPSVRLFAAKIRKSLDYYSLDYYGCRKLTSDYYFGTELVHREKCLEIWEKPCHATASYGDQWRI